MASLPAFIELTRTVLYNRQPGHDKVYVVALMASTVIHQGEPRAFTVQCSNGRRSVYDAGNELTGAKIQAFPVGWAGGQGAFREAVGFFDRTINDKVLTKQYTARPDGLTPMMPLACDAGLWRFVALDDPLYGATLFNAVCLKIIATVRQMNTERNAAQTALDDPMNEAGLVTGNENHDVNCSCAQCRLIHQFSHWDKDDRKVLPTSPHNVPNREQLAEIQRATRLAEILKEAAEPLLNKPGMSRARLLQLTQEVRDMVERPTRLRNFLLPLQLFVEDRGLEASIPLLRVFDEALTKYMSGNSDWAVMPEAVMRAEAMEIIRVHRNPAMFPRKRMIEM